VLRDFFLLAVKPFTLYESLMIKIDLGWLVWILRAVYAAAKTAFFMLFNESGISSLLFADFQKWH